MEHWAGVGCVDEGLDDEGSKSAWDTRPVRKRRAATVLLSLFVGSVLANAVLGIWALLSGDFGETQRKILGTSFLVSAAMLSVLVNVPASRRRALWPAPLVGAVAGATGFAFYIVLMWTEAGDDGWFKLAGSLLVVAAAATLASSLALVTPPARLRWLLPMSDVLLALLAVTVIVGLWAEPDVGWYPRLLGIEGVLAAAMTLLIPVLNRFSFRDQDGVRERVTADPTSVRFCPSCGRPVAQSSSGAGEPAVCEACGLTFEVRIVTERV